MDGSLASIFMSPATAQSWLHHDEESPEELQYKLVCASMELQHARAAAKAEEEIQEAKLCHLHELLSSVKKERDEAREECRKLQVRLSQQSMLSADSPCSFVPSSSSPSSSPWSLHELEEHLNNDNFCNFAKSPASMDPQHTLQSFSRSCSDGLRTLFSIDPTCETIPEDSKQQFNLEVLEEDLSFDADPSLSLAELEQNEGLKGVCDSSRPMRTLSRQSSSNSSSASVHMSQRMQSPRDSTEMSASTISPISVMGVDVTADAVMSAMVNDNAPSHVGSSKDNDTTSVKGNLPLYSSSPPQKIPISHAVHAEGTLRSTALDTIVSVGSPIAPSSAKQQANSTHVRKIHLPEPPEADPQVMLSSLPERGKLLQAVMQAGPLLQTLLLAGPLPQWRHPPPTLSSGDIPKVSVLPSNAILPYPSQGHVKYHTPISNGGFSHATRVRAVNADPCSRMKKLRKLSPALPHQNPSVHMMSGDGMVAFGVSHPRTIY